MRKALPLAVALMAPVHVFSETIDWPVFFSHLLSRDRAVQAAALGRMGNEILPLLCSAKPETVAPEVPGLITELGDSNPQVRVEASAFLFTMARFRPDSAKVLEAAVPLFIEHDRGDTQDQVRQNCVNALAELKPDLPPQALPTLLELAETGDALVQPGAIGGLARLAASHPEALAALKDILLRGNSPRAKKVVLRAIPKAHITDTQLLRALGGFLSDANPDLQRAALLAINECGVDVAALNRSDLVTFAETSSDKDLVGLARRLVDRADRK